MSTVRQKIRNKRAEERLCHEKSNNPREGILECTIRGVADGIRTIGFFLWAVVLIPIAHAGPNLPVITTLKQVRALSLEEAKLEYPVKLSGVVTVLSGSTNSFFFADETAGISIDRNTTWTPKVHSGDRIEVSGVSEPGFFAPSVTSNHVRILNQGKLPTAPLKSFQEMAGGALYSQWIEIRGVVHAASIAESWGRQVLFLETDVGGGSITVRVHDFPPNKPGESYRRGDKCAWSVRHKVQRAPAVYWTTAIR